MAAARAGDLRAWLEITRRHQEAIFRSAYIAARDADVAGEVTRRTFSRAYRSLGSLDDGAAMLPWLMGISTAVARAYLRELAQRRDARSVETTAFPRRPATPIRLDAGLPVPTRFEREALSSAFERSSDHDRLTISSRYAFQLDRASAAVRLGVSPDQVERELGDSVRRLRSHVVESLSEPPVAGPAVPPAAGPGAPTAHRILTLADDALGSLTMAVVLSEMPWTPDVAMIVCDSLAREAVSYPVPQGAGSGPSGLPGGEGVDAPGQTGPRADLTATVPQETPRRGGWSSPRTTALFVGSALVAFSLAAVASGPAGSGDVGARVAGLIGGGTEHETTGAQAEGSQRTPLPVDPGEPRETIEPVLQRTQPGGLDVSMRSARARGKGDVAAWIRLDWPRPSDIGTVVRTRLERHVGSGPWTTIARTDDADPIRTRIKPGKRYSFRLRSFGVDGLPALSPEAQVELVVRGPRSSRLTRHGQGWVVGGGPLGRRLVGTGPGLGVSTTFSGRHVAVVAPAGPARRAMEISIDSGPWVRKDGAPRQRSVGAILVGDALDDGRHELDIRGGKRGLALDGVLFLRTASLSG